MWYDDINKPFDALVGQTLVAVDGMKKGSDSVLFTTVSGTKYSMYHTQDCCESVELVDVVGDVADLLDTPIVVAREDRNAGHDDGESYESSTWTFYTIRTIKGTVTLRWLGVSNGYYSESVDFVEIAPKKS